MIRVYVETLVVCKLGYASTSATSAMLEFDDHVKFQAFKRELQSSTHNEHFIVSRTFTEM